MGLEREIHLFFSDVLGLGGGDNRGSASSDTTSGLGAVSWRKRFPVGDKSSNGEEWTHCEVLSSVLIWGFLNSGNSKSSPNPSSKNASSKTLSLAFAMAALLSAPKIAISFSNFALSCCRILSVSASRVLRSSSLSFPA